MVGGTSDRVDKCVTWANSRFYNNLWKFSQFFNRLNNFVWQTNEWQWTLTIEQWIQKLSSPDESPSVLFCHYYRFASNNLHFPNHHCLIVSSHFRLKNKGCLLDMLLTIEVTCSKKLASNTLKASQSRAWLSIDRLKHFDATPSRVCVWACSSARWSQAQLSVWATVGQIYRY